MIHEECKKEVLEFLKKHHSPSIRPATTMYTGHVVCISPIQTICGAELMCNPNTSDELRNLIATTNT